MIKSKALNLTVSTALLLSMAAVAGCGNANDGNTTRTNNVDGGRIGVNSVRNNQNAGRAQQHDLTNLKYSKELSKKVSGINGVGTAHVFVTNRNAYVSLSKDGQNGANTNNINGRVTGMSTGANRNATGGTGAMTGTNRTNTMTGANTNTTNTNRTFGTSGTGSVGLLRGMANNTRRAVDNTTGLGTGLGRNADNRGFGVNGTANNGGFGGSGYNTLNGTRNNGLMGTNGTGTDGWLGTNGATNDTHMGTGINGVPYGATGNNMGIMSNNNQEDVPQHIRQEVTSKIRKTAPHINQVYVSTDEGFYQQANGFVTNGNAENTVGTLARDFGSWINRIFPLNLGGRNGMNDTRGNLNKNDTDDGWFGGNRNSR